jgi:2-methylisocitrate lyase-like PEP mutase family enzyme
MARRNLRAALAGGEFILAPGLHDMIAAVVANRVGFDFAYASGFWMTASGLGLPDAGIATYTQMLDRVATLCRLVDATVIADADTGYGGLLNVHHTVQGYEAAGVGAIQLEDQVFPKKCGHTPNRACIPAADMARKVEVACAARTRPDGMLVIARTDARQAEGFEAAIARAETYAAAGADILFVEALESEAEMREACARLDRPVMANMADGGRTPIRSAAQLQEIGFRLAIFPAMTGLAAALAVERALVGLKHTGTSLSGAAPLFDFDTFTRMIGFEEVWEFERRWAGAEGPTPPR